MHIGLIGGIGPAATVAYYEKLVSAFKTAGLPLELTIVHADVVTLIANAAAGQRDEQAQIFANHIRQLVGAGCDVAAITALTGHFCLAETQALSALPIVSAIDPVDQYCKEAGIGTIGLLGSPPVMASRLFGQLNNVKTVIPAGNLDDVGDTYLELARTGACTDSAREILFDAGSDMIGKQGADAILLAGTDLGLAFDDNDPGFPTIDALTVHVGALVKMAREWRGGR